MAFEHYVKNDPSCPDVLVQDYEKAQDYQEDTDDEEEVEEEFDDRSGSEDKESEDDGIDFGLPELQGKTTFYCMKLMCDIYNIGITFFV